MSRYIALIVIGKEEGVYFETIIQMMVEIKQRFESFI